MFEILYLVCYIKNFVKLGSLSILLCNFGRVENLRFVNMTPRYIKVTMTRISFKHFYVVSPVLVYFALSPV